MGLLDAVVEAATSRLSGSLASQLGEPQEAVNKGLETGSAALLSGIANKAGDSSFMSKIMNLATSASDAGVLSGRGELPASASGLGSSLLSAVFGGQQSSILNAIGRAAGLRSGSAGGLMSALAPVVLGYLGSRIKSGGLNASGLANLFKSEASSFSRAMPGELGNLMPGAAVPAMESQYRDTQYREQRVASKTHAGAHKSRSWLWPAILGSLLLLGGLLWWNSRDRAGPESPPQPAPAPQATETREAPGEDFAFITRRLPNGVDLRVPRNSVVARVLDAVESGAIDSSRWFVFDTVQFGTDSSTLQPAGMSQLADIANVMKAYPGVSARVGAFTDNTGEADHNLQLSQARATAVVAELVRLGVPANRLEAKGYGEEQPIADNSTEAGRQQNRRVAIQLMPAAR